MQNSAPATFAKKLLNHIQFPVLVTTTVPNTMVFWRLPIKGSRNDATGLAPGSHVLILSRCTETSDLSDTFLCYNVVTEDGRTGVIFSNAELDELLRVGHLRLV